MGKFAKGNTYANQKGHQQVMCKSCKSTSNNASITPPHPMSTKAKHSTKGSRKTETAVSPDTDTSNGG